MKKHILKLARTTLIAAFGMQAWSANAITSDISDMFPVLAESQSVLNASDLGIDPANLTLSQDSTVTAYFISEGAGYKNSFGWYDAATNPTDYANRNEIWNNASANRSGGNLNLGDSVVIGKFDAGTQLGFYLTANGYYYGDRGNTYYTDDALNPDGISHVVAGLLPDQGLLAIGFEDLWGGGDRDYNDIIIAIDIGVENAQQIAAGAPEPSEWALMIVGSLTLLGVARRRMKLNEGTVIPA